MRWLLALAAVAMSVLVSSSGAAETDSVTLVEVLRSVRAYHPTLAEAKELILVAEGDAASSEGAFDPKLKLGAKGQPLGKYDKGQLEAIVTQVTPWWGASFFAGWRRGFGSFALYDGNLETLSGGEVSTGFELPLWRGGPIDEMRATMQRAELEVLTAKQRHELAELLVENAAVRAYWSWVAAGRHLALSESLLDVAARRVAGLERRIEKGDAAAILGVDNRRIVMSRRAKVIAARRKLAESAAKLSLYWRDEGGDPLLATRDQMPTEFDEARSLSNAELVRDIRRARRKRPDVAALALMEESQQVEVAFRDNQVAPSINLSGWLAKDLGSGKDDLRPLDLGVGVTVEIPLLLRKERGKLASARAKLAATRQKTRWARDKVEAEIRAAHAAVVAAAETVTLARDQRVAAERLADAERRRFELGETDLLTVNLRELSAAEAAAQEIDARAEHLRAYADYRTAAALR